MENSNNGYMLLFRGKDWDDQVASEDIQAVLDRFMAWSDGLVKGGKVKGGQPLARTGVVLGRGGRAVADGPFAETKEAVGGYMILDVETMEEATAIAKTSPGLDFGVIIEVRPVLEDCPCFARLRERLEIRDRLENRAEKQAA